MARWMLGLTLLLEQRGVNRLKQLNGLSSISFGLNSTAYWSDWIGVLDIGARRFKVSGVSAAGYAQMVIELVA
jgi:hypothetical protein